MLLLKGGDVDEPSCDVWVLGGVGGGASLEDGNVGLRDGVAVAAKA